jgi:prepilin-type N-terminal cleavage/methylation domain-containing protein
MSAPRHARAFTLIELLVVVSIIVLLIALILPALRQGREAAITVKCESQLHQIGFLSVAYAQDYRGYLFQTLGDGLIAGVNKGAKLYIDGGTNSEKRILFCPNIPTDPSGFLLSEWDEPGITGGPGYYRIGYMWVADPIISTASYWVDSNGNGSIQDEFVRSIDDPTLPNKAICVDWSRKRVTAGWQFRHPVSPVGTTSELMGDGRVIQKPYNLIVDRWYLVDPLGW